MKLRQLAVAIALPMAALTGVTCAPGVANAQRSADPMAQNEDVAKRRFADAKRLMTEGKHADACPKLEESQRLVASPETQLELAGCYEHIGRTASAWALLLDVAATAKSARMADREKLARERAAAIEPKLAKLLVVVLFVPRGLEISRDGVIVGEPQWGSAFPIDPGSHVITASAPGTAGWKSKIHVAPGERSTVVIPALEAAAAPTPRPVTTPPHEAQSRLGTQKTLALVAAGVGVVGLGVGTVFGLQDKSKLDESQSHCVGNACDAAGVALREDAVAAGNISTVAFTVGLVGAAGAAVLWFTAPSSSTQQPATSARFRARVTPTLGASAAGLTLKGAF